MANYTVIYHLEKCSEYSNCGIVDYSINKDLFFKLLKMICDLLKIKKPNEKKYYICKKGTMMLMHNMHDEKEILYKDMIHDAKKIGNNLYMMYNRESIPTHKMASTFEYDDEYVLNRCSFKFNNNNKIYLRFDECIYTDETKVYSILCTYDGNQSTSHEKEMVKVLDALFQNNNETIIEYIQSCKK
jgi:uncharacterized protein (UPF0248 family)